MATLYREGMGIWDEIEIGQRKCAVWRFPFRSLYVERVDIEWHVLSLPESSKGTEVSRLLILRSQKPLSSAWRHYLAHESSLVMPVPVLPDRPVVIRPDRPLTILPGEKAQFFLEIPVWFRLTTLDENRKRIFEEPLAILSNTWFGDPLNGDLCYSLDIRLHQSIQSVGSNVHSAVCPLHLTNDSASDLPLEKVCLHVENLSVFKGETRLWTNGMNVIFKGAEQATQIQITPSVPLFEENLVLAADARLPAEGWNIKKTFSMLKYFTEF
jgi:hypothetical protein